MGWAITCHLQSKEDPKTGWWAPCKLLDLSVLAISTAQLDTCGPDTLPVESSPTRPLAGPRRLAVLQTGPGLTAGRRVAVVLSLVSSPDVAELASMRQAGLSQRPSPGATVRTRQTWHAISPTVYSPQSTGHRAVVQDVHVSALAMFCAHADADAVVLAATISIRSRDRAMGGRSVVLW